MPTRFVLKMEWREYINHCGAIIQPDKHLNGVSSGCLVHAGRPRRRFLFSTDLPFLDLALR